MAAHIIEALGLLGSSKIKASLWLIENQDENNNIFVSAQKLAKLCNRGESQAKETLKF